MGRHKRNARILRRHISCLARVETIQHEGTPEQIAAMRDKEKKGKGVGVRTMYEVQNEKVKNKKSGGAGKEKHVKRENIKLFNKDFRLITR